MMKRMSSNLMCLVAVDQEVLGSKVGQEVPNLANSLLIPPTQHDVQCHNDPQMSLDYHLVDPLGDDENRWGTTQYGQFFNFLRYP
jgi:hypothetical protein